MSNVQQVYHAIFHYMVTPPGGPDYDSTMHAYALDFFGMWTSTGDVYGSVVDYSDGRTSSTLPSCERPHLVLENSVPTALVVACNLDAYIYSIYQGRVHDNLSGLLSNADPPMF